MSKVDTKRLIQVIAIGFILVVCPAASWYYLQKGLNYQKDARKELVAKESVAVQNFIPEFVSKDSTLLHNKLRLVVLKQDNSNEKIVELSKKLFEQFEQSKGLLLLTLNKASNDYLSGSSQINSMHINKIINSDEYTEIATKIIGLPVYKEIEGKVVLEQLSRVGPTSLPKEVYGYLIDQHDKVRNVYNLLDEDRVKRMVEHIAILIPRPDREEVELRREKEM